MLSVTLNLNHDGRVFSGRPRLLPGQRHVLLHGDHGELAVLEHGHRRTPRNCNDGYVDGMGLKG